MSEDRDLERCVQEAIDVSRRRGYDPHIFVRMCEHHGTVAAMERLMVAPSAVPQSGFRRLRELDLLEWSVEALVLRFPEQFSADARKIADWRLQQARAGRDI